MKSCSRRFTIADVMILVAATAVGFVLLRTYRENVFLGNPQVPFPFLQNYTMEFSPILFVCPLTLLVARAIPPRPAVWRIFRQPGTVACLVSYFDIIVNTIIMTVRHYLGPYRMGIENYIWVILRSGHSVALAWLVMALVGAWRPEASWVDRAGRALGVILIGLWILLHFDI